MLQLRLLVEQCHRKTPQGSTNNMKSIQQIVTGKRGWSWCGLAALLEWSRSLKAVFALTTACLSVL
jgi:hypothetical protein